jgi:hypothetical protein
MRVIKNSTLNYVQRIPYVKGKARVWVVGEKHGSRSGKFFVNILNKPSRTTDDWRSSSLWARTVTKHATERSNASSDCMRCRELFDQLADYEVLKNDYPPWRWFLEIFRVFNFISATNGKQYRIL